MWEASLDVVCSIPAATGTPEVLHAYQQIFLGYLCAKAMAHHSHDHAEHEDWEHRADSYNEMVDLLEPELSKATNTLLAAAQVQSGCLVLDLACGLGHVAGAATAMGAAATGLDSSPSMLRIAGTRFPETEFVLGDMTAPPPGPWDAITCRMGAHHSDPSWLESAWHALKTGGRLAIAETGAVDAHARANHMLDPDEWVSLFAGAGFRQIEVLQSGANMSAIPIEALKGEDAHAPPKGPIFIVVGTK